MGAYRRGKALGRLVERLIPVDAPACLTTLLSRLRIQQAVSRIGCQIQGCPLGAQATTVGRVIGVAPHTDTALAFRFDQTATTNAAVATSRLDFRFHVFSFRSASEQQACHLEKSWTCNEKREIPIRNFPFLVQEKTGFTLFDALQLRTPIIGARRFRWRLGS